MQTAVAVASDIVVNANETPQEATDRFAESLLRYCKNVPQTRNSS